MYERVVLPTDGSETAEIGVKEGLEVAKKLGIPALSIYVMDISKYEEIKRSELDNRERKSMKKVGERALRSVRVMAHDMGVKITTRLVLGEPYKRIIQIAGERDIIFMSSHGASGFSEMFFGSTTERVTKNAKCTVAVVKGKFK